MVINIPRQQLLNPLIIVNGELVNITVQDPLYMFHHYGFSPYTLNMVETVNLNGSRYTVYAVITEAAMAVVGYNQTGKYYQFPQVITFAQHYPSLLMSRFESQTQRVLS